MARAGAQQKAAPHPADILGMQIKLLRTVRRMKQQELARASGVTVAHLSKLEAGKYNPHRSTIELLAGALGVEADELCRP